jgi:hypothetical protein
MLALDRDGAVIACVRVCDGVLLLLLCLALQDVGAVSLIRAVAPQLAIHGSTQMSITSAEGAEFAAGEVLQIACMLTC